MVQQEHFNIRRERLIISSLIFIAGWQWR